MAAGFHVSRPARRQIERLPLKVQPAMWELIAHVAEQPFRLGVPLQPPLLGEFSARRGPYRVLYRIDDTGGVEVTAVAHRAESYRRR